MTTRIAVPITGDLLCTHFGQSEAFALFDVDPRNAAIVAREDIEPPPHEPGTYPKWLAEQGTTLVLAGGMGERAQAVFAHLGIHTILGVEEQLPQRAVTRYLRGELTPADRTRCAHHESDSEHGNGSCHGSSGAGQHGHGSCHSGSGPGAHEHGQCRGGAGQRPGGGCRGGSGHRGCGGH